ncbi:unnamed protein product [Effrenium voratum]|nr:unnamed protein product [Effrenium voratum]
MHRHCDADVANLLETSVPPADVSKVTVFASHLKKYNDQAGLDFKYINDRFQKGKSAVANFIKDRHQIHTVTNLLLGHPEIVKLQAALGQSALLGSAMDVDGSIALAQGVSQGNQGTMGFVLLPQRHSSAPGERVLKNRRLLEVQQRGVEACKVILNSLLEGTTAENGGSLIIVDALPNRFHEWSSACLELQVAELNGTAEPSAAKVTYCGIYTSDDAALAEAAKSFVVGRLVSQWWDKCSEAGPAARPNSSFVEERPALDTLAAMNGVLKIPELILEKYGTTHPESLEKMQKELDAATNVTAALTGVTAALPEKRVLDTPRTLGAPEWDGNPPADIAAKAVFDSMAVPDFKSTKQLLRLNN